MKDAMKKVLKYAGKIAGPSKTLGLLIFYETMNLGANLEEDEKQKKQQFKEGLFQTKDSNIVAVLSNIYALNNDPRPTVSSDGRAIRKSNFDVYQELEMEDNLNGLYSALKKNPVVLSDTLVEAVVECQKNINLYAFDRISHQPASNEDVDRENGLFAILKRHDF